MDLVHNTQDIIHEEQVLGHSRAIEKLNAEMQYKKEKLDDLKEDNRRMEEKIDEIKECINELILKSKTDDDKLEQRLVAIETEQKTIKEQNDKNRAIMNLKLAIITVVFGLVSLLIAVLTFYFSFR